MPHIFDNIEQKLLPAVQGTLQSTDHTDFRVDTFKLRSWKNWTPSLETFPSPFLAFQALSAFLPGPHWAILGTKTY
jgi:hypothetical protein